MAKKNRKPQAASTSVFNYTSVCCKVKATKPAVEMPTGKGIGQFLGATTEGDASLGKWRCTGCGRKAKVTRAFAKDVKSTSPAPEAANG